MERLVRKMPDKAVRIQFQNKKAFKQRSVKSLKIISKKSDYETLILTGSGSLLKINGKAFMLEQNWTPVINASILY